MAVASAACAKSSASPECALCSSSAVVRGTVTDTLGAPQQGASVTLQVFANSCSGTSVGFVASGYPQTTDAAGNYRYLLLTIKPAFAACIEARAALVSDTSFRADTIVAGSLVQFNNTYPAGAPLDSLTVNMVLRHH